MLNARFRFGGITTRERFHCFGTSGPHWCLKTCLPVRVNSGLNDPKHSTNIVMSSSHGAVVQPPERAAASGASSAGRRCDEVDPSEERIPPKFMTSISGNLKILFLSNL